MTKLLSDTDPWVQGFKAVRDEFEKRFTDYKNRMDKHHAELMKQIEARVELLEEMLSRSETKEIEYDKFNRPVKIKTKRE